MAKNKPIIKVLPESALEKLLDRNTKPLPKLNCVATHACQVNFQQVQGCPKKKRN